MNKAAVIHILKKGGISIPPLAVTLIWLCTSYLTFPQQAPKTNTKNISDKPPKAKLAKKAGSPSSTKISDTQRGTNKVLLPTITPAITPQVVSNTTRVTTTPTIQPPAPTPAPSHQTVPATPAPSPKDASANKNTISTPLQHDGNGKNTTNDTGLNVDQTQSPVSPLLHAADGILKPALSLPLLSEK